jgi:hypothetical protein
LRDTEEKYGAIEWSGNESESNAVLCCADQKNWRRSCRALESKRAGKQDRIRMVVKLSTNERIEKVKVNEDNEHINIIRKDSKRKEENRSTGTESEVKWRKWSKRHKSKGFSESTMCSIGVDCQRDRQKW